VTRPKLVEGKKAIDKTGYFFAPASHSVTKIVDSNI
jgi:hypothetical protein